MENVFAFVSGIGWGIALTMVGCWLVGVCKKKHDYDVTNFMGDEALETEQRKLTALHPDGKAVFLPDFTEPELKEHQEQDLLGWKKLYDKLKFW